MSRSYEDISAELLALRNENRTFGQEATEARAEIKALRAELAWWRKTFGPEATASL